MTKRPELRTYQEKARDAITGAVLGLLGKDSTNDRLVVFQSPTGSGKTVTMAYALAAAHAHPNRRDFVVLWLSPGKGGLHRQSARALEYFLEGSTMRVRVLDSREDIEADPNPASGTVLVVNWEKLFRKKNGEFTNVMLRDGETANLFTMLKNVTESGKDMIAVIDESHLGLGAKNTTELVDELRLHRPFIQIEMSATPDARTEARFRNEGLHHDVVVTFRDVESEGMVRRAALLNPDFPAIQKKYAKHSGDVALQVLHGAWDRILSLRAGFNAEKSRVRPLLLIQYPDGDEADARAEVVEQFLAKVGLKEGETYAKYLAEEHSANIDKIAAFDSPYEALIFKQAIATGWDCPRAQVLVQFRNPKSPTFKIQVLGRIMRSPEQRHYDNEELNVAYVYSDLEGVEVKVVPDDEHDLQIRDVLIRRGNSYPSAGLKLQSVFQPRKRELHYPLRENLEPALRQALEDHVLPHLPADAISSSPVRFLQNAFIDANDLLTTGEGQFQGELGEGLLGIQLAQAFFDRILTADIGPYTSREQSRARIKAIIVNWTSENRLGWLQENIQHFVIQNEQAIIRAVSTACIACAAAEDAKAVAAARARIRRNEKWEVPATDLVSKETHEESAKGNLMDPPLVEKSRPNTERRFEEWLSGQLKSKRIQWWWKNGERDEKYLGVEYEFQGVTERTYPDFLVLTADDVLWVLEVKDVNDPQGLPGDSTEAKAIGLTKWAAEQNRRRADDKAFFDTPEVRAGVVVPLPLDKTAIPMLGDSAAWTEPSPLNLANKAGWTDLIL
jgi:type III restriction enzyme